VISIGTGYSSKKKAGKMGWDTIVNNLISTSTDTEDVHALLLDFLPPDKYFRFNVAFNELLAIDEKNKALLNSLKTVAGEYFRKNIDAGPDKKRFDDLMNTLKINKVKSKIKI
jgi:hypothetical protein